MDETYQTYLNRVARLTLSATYQSQLQHIQESPKFKPLPDGSRQAVPFPGYTVSTPPQEEDSENSAFYDRLQKLQQQLVQQLDVGLIVPVPLSSFHLTLADLIWDSAYRAAERENPEYDKQLHERIRESFQTYQRSPTQGNPLCWQVLGLAIRPRAIEVGLAPEDEKAYKQMLEFRRAIYQNRGLMALGVQQQYNFTAHITLGYFGEISANLDRDRLASKLSELNQQALPEESTPLCVRRAELRKFDDMMRYYRQPEWPAVEF